MNDGSRRIPAVRTNDDGVVPIHNLDRSNVLVASEFGYYDEHEADSFDFRSALSVVYSRKWMILAIVVVGLLTTFLLVLRDVPLFSATATIEIQQQEVQIIEGTNVGPDIVADGAYLETQYRLIRSRSLAERVAEDFNLLNDPQYADLTAPRISRVRQAAGRLLAGTRVSPIGGSRLVGISFVSPSQTESARIANAIAETYIQTNIERKFNTTAFAREFLDEQLDNTKRLLEDSERRFTQYAEAQGLLDIGGRTTGAGSLEENAIVSLNQELSVAESERIRAEQEYLIASEAKPALELLQSTTLNNLRQSRSRLEADYQDKLSQFKPEFPEMVRLQSRIDLVDAEIEREAENIVLSELNQLRLVYEAAVAREQSLVERVNELRGQLQEDRNRRIQYRILQREVETISAQYDALLQRSKEVSIASGVGSTNVSIVDLALVPRQPFQPNLERSLLQAFILSLALGLGLAFVLNFLDDTIKSPEDVRGKLGLPLIGIIPKLSGRKDVLTDALEQPKSAISEAFTAAQTALEFSTAEGPPSSLLITSTRPGEGKTSTTIALAVAFARSGKRVLIIDADMRKPSFVVDTSHSAGLSGLLTGHEFLMDHVVKTKTNGLSILPAGVIPPDPAQLLSGPRLREILEDAESMFDTVIVDSPPILNFADGPRLGSIVGGALIVIQSGLIRTPMARRTIAQLGDSRTNIIGCMLSKFDAKTAGHDYGYYYAPYGKNAASHISYDSKRDLTRRIQIDVESDAEDVDENENERWA